MRQRRFRSSTHLSSSIRACRPGSHHAPGRRLRTANGSSPSRSGRRTPMHTISCWCREFDVHSPAMPWGTLGGARKNLKRVHPFHSSDSGALTCEHGGLSMACFCDSLAVPAAVCDVWISPAGLSNCSLGWKGVVSSSSPVRSRMKGKLFDEGTRVLPRAQWLPPISFPGRSWLEWFARDDTNAIYSRKQKQSTHCTRVDISRTQKSQ